MTETPQPVNPLVRLAVERRVTMAMGRPRRSRDGLAVADQTAAGVPAGSRQHAYVGHSPLRLVVARTRSNG